MIMDIGNYYFHMTAENLDVIFKVALLGSIRARFHAQCLDTL